MYAKKVVITSEDLTDRTILLKSKFSKSLILFSALWKRASAVGAPCFFKISFSKEPEFIPILMGTFFSLQAFITALIFSIDPIFAGKANRRILTF